MKYDDSCNGFLDICIQTLYFVGRACLSESGDMGSIPSSCRVLKVSAAIRPFCTIIRYWARQWTDKILFYCCTLSRSPLSRLSPLLAGRRATNLDWKRRKPLSKTADPARLVWIPTTLQWVAACARIRARAVGVAGTAGQYWTPPSSRSMASGEKKCWKCGLNATARAPMSKSAPKTIRRPLNK